VHRRRYRGSTDPHENWLVGSYMRGKEGKGGAGTGLDPKILQTYATGLMNLNQQLMFQPGSIKHRNFLRSYKLTVSFLCFRM
jgi:hypothetical protein